MSDKADPLAERLLLKLRPMGPMREIASELAAEARRYFEERLDIEKLTTAVVHTFPLADGTRGTTISRDQATHVERIVAAIRALLQ